MEMPTVKSSIRDKQNDVTYHVLAYRKLTREELVLAIGHFHSQPSMRRRKAPLRKATITFHSLFGATRYL